MEYHGLAVSAGIAIGKAFHYACFDVESCLAQLVTIEEKEPQSPVKRFSGAVERVREELHLQSSLLSQKSPEQAGILDAHIEIAEDEALKEDVLAELQSGSHAGDAVHQVFSQYIALFSKSKEERIRERTADLVDVRNRILRAMAGMPEQNLSHLKAPRVIFAHDLLPADTATIDRKNVLAIVTEIGGDTSHTSIIARSYGIPCIVGVENICEQIEEGKTVIVDAINGVILQEPSAEVQKEYLLRQEKIAAEKQETEQFRSRPAVTTDGVHIDICVNLAKITPEALSAETFTDGVGLFRTEFLYMGRMTPPTEEEQQSVYREVLAAYGEKPVVLRTLDIGGDKKVDCLSLPQEQNPFLGQRALRLCFAQPELFRTQLRAALGASPAGTLWIMFPMVGSVEDFLRAKAMLEEEKQKLQNTGFVLPSTIRIGAMIEIPSMAIAADRLAREADFASIGSNDLTQYMLAVDRTEPAVAEYCQKYHPAVLRAIAMAAKSFVQAGKPISICGELGGDPIAVPFLIGCGMRKLSMSEGLVAEVKKTVSLHSITDCRLLTEKVCNAGTAGEAENLLRGF